MKRILLLALLMVSSIYTNAQSCSTLMEPVSLQSRSNEANLIVEGEVLNSTSYWDVQHHNIYTIHEILVYKNAKGATLSKVFVETEGGQVGEHIQITSYAAKLNIGDEGVFFLKPSNHTFGMDSPTYKMVAAAQGFVKYDTIDKKASDSFEVYPSIENDFYTKLQNATNSPLTVIQEKAVISNSYAPLATPVISGFSPATISAGTESILTITGSNFGASAGTVSFRFANDGGGTYVAAEASQILSWTDTQIQVEVPDEAGTGTIRVTNATDETGTSTTSLTIPYSHLSATGGGIVYPRTLYSDNGNGGFTFEYHNDFNTSNAKPYFEEAFGLWNCQSGVHFDLGSTTATDVTAEDGVNIVRFDNGAELPSGVLGAVTTRLLGACPTTGRAIVNELDVTWNDDTNWYFGEGTPGATQYDFKTVALHELGHAHQLGHIINPTGIMHYNLGPGVEKYNLTSEDIAGANFTMGVFTQSPGCGIAPMTEDNGCAYVPDDNFEAYLEANNLGNGIANDNYVSKELVSSLTFLSLFNQGISDLTGIEHFTALTTLNVHDNNLTSVDLSQNVNVQHLQLENNTGLANIDVSALTNLQQFWCSNTAITSLDLSQNTALRKLYVNNTGISTLDLSANVLLDYLVCQQTQLSSLDISNNPLIDTVYGANCNMTSVSLGTNTNLETLSLASNDLTSIDLTGLPALRNLYLTSNDIVSLDLRQNPALFNVNVSDNDLTSLDVRNGNNALVGTFEAIANYELVCINVDDPALSSLVLWNVDTAIFSVDCELTQVPDTNFENYLETHDASGNTVSIGDASSMGNGVANDGWVFTNAINSVTNLTINSLSIADLTGIEDFAALETLACRSNSLTTLDLSGNSALTTIDCYSNQLTSINLTQNTNLTHLSCDKNSLASLDLTQNTQLLQLRCAENDLVTIDLSQNTVLERLYIYRNELTSLDVTQNTVLNRLSCYENSLTSLDVTQNLLLADLDCVENQLTSLDVTQNVNLEYLQVYDNFLTSLDVTQNTLLDELYCYSNQITSLDISNCTVLNEFDASYNNLTSLNAQNGNAANLDTFEIGNNANLYCVLVDDVTYAYANFTDKDAHTFYNQISCDVTSVPDANFENYLETHDASGAVVAIGSPSSMGNGIANDGLVFTSAISVVTSLVMDDLGIADLTGIEDFTALEVLDCRRNNLTSLDLSQNTALIILDCWRNQLTSLDVTQNINLTKIQCGENELNSLDVTQNVLLTELRSGENNLATVDVSQNVLLEHLYVYRNGMTSLDVTQNSALERLSCYENNLTSLDVTQNVLLTDLDCVENQLTSLDVTQNVNLEYLQVYDNFLTSLDVTQNTLLDELYCYSNQISSLDISNCTVLNEFDASYNNLSNLKANNGNPNGFDIFDIRSNPNLNCVLVDDVAYSDANWNYKDAQTSYSETSCKVSIQAKVYLQGAALNPIAGEEQWMRDDLRVAGLIPVMSPYSDGVEIDASVLAITGSDAIVDWVWVELRDAESNTVVVSAQSALLQRDGDVVGLDGISSLEFAIDAKSYYLAAKHRNHLGIMSANTIALVHNTVTSVDFTDAANPIAFGNNPQTSFGMPNGVLAMWAGNVNADTVVQYSGTNPDVPGILSEVLNDPANVFNFPTHIVTGYNIHDVNMDGNTQYTGTSPDSPFVLQNILAHPGNVFGFSTHQIIEQLPENE